MTARAPSAATPASGWIDLLSRLEIGASLAAQRFHDQQTGRWQDPLIIAEVPEGSSVLDLGCGDGELLSRLREVKRVRCQGVELDHEEVTACIGRGVPVLQSDIDQGLKEFPTGCFDFVVLEETLQTLHRPLAVLHEMLRVGRTGIVSFPNFGHWQVRLDLLLRGRMPVTSRLRHHWYDTSNIHHLTLVDFLEWTHEAGVQVDKGFALDEDGVRPLRDEDHLHAAEVLLFIRGLKGG